MQYNYLWGRWIGGVLAIATISMPFATNAASVAAWGDNLYGQIVMPSTLGNVKAISGGAYHSLVLRTDGTVGAWGGSQFGQTNVPSGLSNVVAISAGASHSVALKSGGRVEVWGDSRASAIPVGLSNVIAISAGSSYTLALKADGKVVAWGTVYLGQTSVPQTLSNVIAIAAGDQQSLALKADGTVVAWGFTNNGQTTVPDNLSNVTAIASGTSFSMALKTDGTIIAWGENNFGQTNVPAGLSNVVALSAGSAHALALRDDGSVVAWGDVRSPVPAGLSNVIAIAAGGIHNLALLFDGPVRIIQNPEGGTLPTGTNVTLRVIAAGQQPLSYRWYKSGSAVSGATTSTLFISNLQLTDAGTYTVIVSNPISSVRSLGAQLTLGNAPLITQQPTNLTVRAGTDVPFSAAANGNQPLRYQWNFNGTDIPGATNTLLSLTNVQPGASGLYYMRVTNFYGAAQTLRASLMVTDSAPYILTQPGADPKGSAASQIIPVGSSTTFSVAARGSAPLNFQWRFEGADIPGGTNATLSLTNLRCDQTGYYSVEASNAFGSTNSVKVFLNVVQVYVWGEILQPGTAALLPTNVPPYLTNVVAVASGNYHVLAMRADGRVVTWWNYGLAQATVTNVPASVTNVMAIAAAGDNSMALRSNGSVVVWGDNLYGQNNVPTGVSNAMAIANGGLHCLALRTNGTVIGWGNNSNGQATPPAGLSNVVAIAAGSTHSLALKADGTVIGWGYNYYGQTNPPAGLSNVIAIDAAQNVSLALKADGTAVSWGYANGRVPANITNLVATGVGFPKNVGLKADGSIVSWVSNQTPSSPALSNVIAVTSGEWAAFSAAVIGNGSPFFTLHPASQSAVKSNPVRLHARTAGVQPMSFQWQHDGVNVPGGTNASLTLSNFLGKDIGGYRMIASNALGAVASQIAVVTIPFNTNLSAALGTNNWQLVSEGTPGWFAQNRETHDGNVAAQSGAISNRQQSILQTSYAGPGTLTFWWKVSSEEGFDFLRFYSDNLTIPLLAISGENEWEQRTIHLTSGTHLLRWVYDKDVSVSAGRDAGWLDEVAFTPDPPVITQQPSPTRTLSAGAATTFGYVVSGIGPFGYQWFKDGGGMTGVTQANLTLTNLTRRNSGSYQVQVSNAGGSVMSSNAVLKVIVNQRLGSLQRGADGGIELLSRDADGGALLSQDLPAFEGQASTNLVNWETLPNPLTLTNGSLLLRDSNSSLPRRFYRVVEH